MIAIAIIITTALILIVYLTKHRESYITLEEVIPGARIISQEEGVLEYKGVQYIIGTHDLKKRKYLIERLNLLDLKGQSIVDLRFDTQVIVKRGATSMKEKLNPEKTQSRRR